MEILFLLFVILILIITIYFIKPKHLFWDYQPVMRSYDNYTNNIIGLNGSFKFNINDPTINIKNDYDYEKIYNFINNEFSENLYINNDFFKYHHDLSGALNISLVKNNEIIGFIHSHPVKIVLDKKDLVFYYVDFLCIKKELRTNDLATLLICSILNSVSNKEQPFLFKRDSVKLPFLPILKSKYHYDEINEELDLKVDSSINLITKEVFEENYKLIENYLNQFYFRRKFTLEELNNLLFEKQIIKCYFNYNKQYPLFIFGKNNKLDWGSKTYNTFDIDFILGDSIDLKKDRLELNKQLLKDNYNFVTIPAVGLNINYIIMNNLEGANNYYYYTYNFSTKLLKNSEICFNIN
jgi:hypothetical protein